MPTGLSTVMLVFIGFYDLPTINSSTARPGSRHYPPLYAQPRWTGVARPPGSGDDRPGPRGRLQRSGGRTAGPAVEALAGCRGSRRRAAENRALFASSEPLPFALRADFKAVQRDRDLNSAATHPATLVVATADGTDRSIPVRIRTRGHSRRKLGLCTFAPLRIEFGSNPVNARYAGPDRSSG